MNGPILPRSAVQRPGPAARPAPAGSGRVAATGSKAILRAALFTAVLALALVFILAGQAQATGLQGSSVLALDGVDDYATGPDGPPYDLGTGANDDFTLETRFYVSGVSAPQTGTLFFKTSAYNVYILFNVNGDQDRLIYRLYTSGTSYVYTYYNVTLSDGWHHLAAVFDNESTESGDLFATYLDGSLVAGSTAVDWTPGLPNTSSAFYLGGYFGINSFPGLLEETRISNTVRYSGASYTVPTTPFVADSNTLALWHFDEAPASTTFSDSTGSGNSLTGINGAMTYNVDTTAPDAPTLDQPTSPSAQSEVDLTGTAEALSTVLIYDGATLLGTTTAGPGGAFSYRATLPEGEHSLTARARDAAGNTSEASAARNVTVDTTAPTTTVAGIPAGWSKTNVTATLSPSDALSGMTGGDARTEYSTDGGGAWTTGTSATISTQGTTTLLYRSTDAAGNVETAKSATVRIDTIQPRTFGKAAKGKARRAIKLRYRITDNLSSQATAVRLLVKNKRGKTLKTFPLGTKSTGTWYSVKWKPRSKGTYRYYVYAKDLAGNTQLKAAGGKITVK